MISNILTLLDYFEVFWRHNCTIVILNRELSQPEANILKTPIQKHQSMKKQVPYGVSIINNFNMKIFEDDSKTAIQQISINSPSLNLSSEARANTKHELNYLNKSVSLGINENLSYFQQSPEKR